MNQLEEECDAEFIDGSWSYCGCKDCNEREDADRESDIELNGYPPDSDY